MQHRWRGGQAHHRHADRQQESCSVGRFHLLRGEGAAVSLRKTRTMQEVSLETSSPATGKETPQLSTARRGADVCVLVLSPPGRASLPETRTVAGCRREPADRWSATPSKPRVKTQST